MKHLRYSHHFGGHEHLPCISIMSSTLISLHHHPCFSDSIISSSAPPCRSALLCLCLWLWRPQAGSLCQQGQPASPCSAHQLFFSVLYRQCPTQTPCVLLILPGTHSSYPYLIPFPLLQTKYIFTLKIPYFLLSPFLSKVFSFLFPLFHSLLPHYSWPIGISS